jgi:hypothetical protein
MEYLNPFVKIDFFHYSRIYNAVYLSHVIKDALRNFKPIVDNLLIASDGKTSAINKEYKLVKIRPGFQEKYKTGCDFFSLN